MSTNTSSAPSIPPSQEDLDEARRARESMRQASERHIAAMTNTVVTCMRVTTKRAAAKQKRSKLLSAK